MKVYDLDGSLHDFNWLTTHYAPGMVLCAAQNYPKFELEAVFVTEGPTILRFTVLTAANSGAVGQPVAYSFPSLSSPSGDLPPVPAGADRSGWLTRACIERCDPRGEHEFQIGSESWIKNGVGPYAVQVISPSTYSDCLTGIGWLGGTNHRGPCEFLFREVLGPDSGGDDGDGEEDGEEPPDSAYLAGVILELRAINQTLREVFHLAV